MFLPRIEGRVTRRYDHQRSNFSLNQRSINLSPSMPISPSPQVKYFESVDLSESKLLNSKRRSAFTHSLEPVNLYRPNLDTFNRRASNTRKLKALHDKNTALQVKRSAIEAKIEAGQKLARGYGVLFKRSEIHILDQFCSMTQRDLMLRRLVEPLSRRPWRPSEVLARSANAQDLVLLSPRYGSFLMGTDQLEALAKTIYTEKRRLYACKVIQKNWRRYKVSFTQRKAHALQANAARVIQRHWRKYQVKSKQTEVIAKRNLIQKIEAQVFPLQKRIRGML